VLVIGLVVGDWTPQIKVRCFPSEKTDYDYEHAHEHGNMKDRGTLSKVKGPLDEPGRLR
jgi:hypothetical protein